MDTPDHFSRSNPQVELISAGVEARDRYGHRYGSELLELTDDMIRQIKAGRQLAIEIHTGEYMLFVQYQEDDPKAAE